VAQHVSTGDTIEVDDVARVVVEILPPTIEAVLPMVRRRYVSPNFSPLPPIIHVM
jgi:hypothetical protein